MSSCAKSNRVDLTSQENAGELRVRLQDGAELSSDGISAEIVNGAGQLLVRYRDGAAEIVAAAGDLVLAAPHGRVRMAARDVSIEAEHCLEQRAGRQLLLAAGADEECSNAAFSSRGVALKAHALDAVAQRSRLRSGEASLMARRIQTTAEALVQTVDRYELTAGKLVEHCRDAFRDVSELLQLRVGRARTLVNGRYDLSTQRTSLNSSEETSIDGKKVLLG